MSEQDAIDRSDSAATVASLGADLGRLGVCPGMTLMVHSSLSRLGFIAGGAQSVVEALVGAVGTTGTLMMPTHSTHLSDPAAWVKPPVPPEWWDTIRDETPAYDAALTPTRRMGAIVECFRHLGGVRRSAHPTVSAAAVGPNADVLLDGHELDCGLGEASPQAQLYDLDGHILLLGVSHSNNTSIHLSEYRAAPPDAAMTTYFSPVRANGERVWASYSNLVDDDSDFARIGQAFAASGMQQNGPVGAGDAFLMRARELVDFATEWMQKHRSKP